MVFNGKIWISGGWNLEYTDVVPDQWCSSDGIHWTMVNSMFNRFELNIVYDNKLWQTSHFILNSDDGIEWNYFGVSPEDGYVVLFKNKFWRVGASAIYSSDDIITWTVENNMLPWPERNRTGVLAFDNKLWVMGGVNYPDLTETYNDVWSSTDGINWTQVTSSAGWTPRRFFTPIEYKGKMWVMAGQDTTYPNGVDRGNKNDVWYSSDGSQWYKFNSSVSFPARHAPFTLVFDSSIYIIGGYANNDYIHNDVWKLKISGLTITSDPIKTAVVNSGYSYSVHADFSTNNDTIRYRLKTAPPWMSIDSVSGLITGFPTTTGFPTSCSASDLEVVVEAYTSMPESDIQTYNIQVFNPGSNATISSSGPTTFCKGTSTTLLSLSDNSDIKWNTGDTAKEISVYNSGKYFLIARDINGCFDSSNIVTINTVPNAQISTTADNYICYGDSLMLKSWSNYNGYEWSTGQTTESIYVKDASDYYLTVIDENGCRDTSDILTLKVKPIPAPVIVPSDTLCAGKSNFLSTGQYFNYVWSTGETTRVIDVDKSGDYSVWVEDYDGCQNQANSVYVYPQPEVDITAEPLSTLCTLDSSLLSPSISFPSYQWSTGQTTQTIIVKSTGDYFLTVTDKKGCKGISNTIHIDSDKLPEPILNYNNQIQLCEDDSLILTTMKRYSSYIWNNGDKSDSIKITTSGYYFVTVVNEEGCVGTTDSVSVNFVPRSIADFSYIINNQYVNFNNLSLNSDSYIWNFGDNTESQNISPDHYYSAYDSYKVTLISSNGVCADTVSKPITTFYVNYKIFPNPTTGILKIELNDLMYINFDLYIIDISGSKIIHRKIQSGETLLEIDLSSFANGLYFLDLEYQNKPFMIKKIVKANTYH